MVINNFGRPRLLKFFTEVSEPDQQRIVRKLYSEVSGKSEAACSFLDASTWFAPGVRVVYRQYATLYFAVAIDGNENELGVLDLIQMLVESLDSYFKNVCELDLIFKIDQVHWLVDEIFVGGMMAETSTQQIIEALQAQSGLVREESDFTAASLQALHDSGLHGAASSAARGAASRVEAAAAQTMAQAASPRALLSSLSSKLGM